METRRRLVDLNGKYSNEAFIQAAGSPLKMKYLILMPAMGLLSIVLGIQHLPFGAVVVWFGCCWGIVGVGYAKPGMNLFGKNNTGQIPLHSKIIFFPYLAFTYLVWCLICRIGSEDPYNQVDENLIIGRRLLPREMPTEITHILDLTTEFSEPTDIVTGGTYIHFPIMDAHVPTSEALASLLEVLPEDGVLYIHCAQGHGRTGMVALALLAKRKRVANLADGLALLQGKRAQLNINSQQSRFVEAFLERMSEASD